MNGCYITRSYIECSDITCVEARNSRVVNCTIAHDPRKDGFCAYISGSRLDNINLSDIKQKIRLIDIQWWVDIP